MSKQANPLAVGAFVIGAIVLIVVGVLAFSSGQFFKKQFTIVGVFPGTVVGLEAGSAVEFRGFPVGEVESIRAFLDPTKNTVTLAVYMKITTGLLSLKGAAEGPLTETQEEALEMFKKFIQAGLRATVKVQSLVTGQAIVELDFKPNTPVTLTHVDERYPEIPTVPSTVGRIVHMLQTLPLQKLVEKAVGTFDAAEQVLRSQDLKDTLHNANLATQDARKLLVDADDQIQPLSTSAQETLDQARATLAAVGGRLNATLDDISTLARHVDGKVDPLSQSAIAALDEARSAFKSVDDLIGEDSPTRADFENTLEQLSGAARSLRVLADYMEQHPDALLKGKGY